MSGMKEESLLNERPMSDPSFGESETRLTGMAMSGAAAMLVLVCLCPAASARDIVYLKGGQFLEGEVTKETDDTIWIKVGKGTMRLSRSRVIRIERAKPLPSWEARLRAKLKEDSQRRAEAARGAAEKAQEQKKAEDSKKSDEKAMRLVNDLASKDSATRKEAATLLEREGPRAIPALTRGLSHSSSFARVSSARLLGRLRARESVRELIISLRSAVPETTKIRPWQRPFVRALRTSIATMTGQDFGVSFYGTHQGKAAEKYVAWWDGENPSGAKEGAPEPRKGACIEWDTPQVGEEPVAEDDSEREQKLYDTRRIGNERRNYSPPKSFTDPLGDASERL